MFPHCTVTTEPGPRPAAGRCARCGAAHVAALATPTDATTSRRSRVSPQQSALRNTPGPSGIDVIVQPVALDRLDHLARSSVTGGSRRRLPGALTAVPVLSGLLPGLDPEEANAKDRRRRGKQRRSRRRAPLPHLPPRHSRWQLPQPSAPAPGRSRPDHAIPALPSFCGSDGSGGRL